VDSPNHALQLDIGGYIRRFLADFPAAHASMQPRAITKLIHTIMLQTST